MFMGNEQDIRLAEGALAEMLASYWWDMFSVTGVQYFDGYALNAQSLCKYFSLLYMENKYGKEFVQEQYVVPMEQQAKITLNSFYPNHKKLAHLLPYNFANEVYVRNAYTQSSAVFDPLVILEIEGLVGRPKFISAVSRVFEAYKGQPDMYASPDVILAELNITLEDISLYMQLQQIKVEQVYE